MKKLEFKFEDFYYRRSSPLEIAQKIFDDWYKETIESAKVVYGTPSVGLAIYGKGTMHWSEECGEGVTKTALLIDLRVAGAETCKHAAVHQQLGRKTLQEFFVCNDCGTTLRPRNGWEPVC